LIEPVLFGVGVEPPKEIEALVSFLFVAMKGCEVGLATRGRQPILGRLPEIVVSEQLERYCETVRPCPRRHRRRHLKDYRCRRFDTVFGRLGVRAPRFDGCRYGCRHCGERRIASPVSELLPERVSPELRHLHKPNSQRSFLTSRPLHFWKCKPFSGASVEDNTRI
jgi:hypothetical protein